MPTENPFPLDFTSKENSPQLEAFFSQYGKKFYADATELNNMYKALNYLYENIPSVKFIPKGDLFSNTVVATVATETHIYTAKYAGVRNGISFKTNDILAFTTDSTYIFANNNQVLLRRIFISTAVHGMLPILTEQKVLDTSVSSDGFIPVDANSLYEFEFRCHITELSNSNNYLSFLIKGDGIIENTFRYYSNSSKNSNAVTPSPELRLIHNGGSGYGEQNVLSVNSPNRPDMFIDIKGVFKTLLAGNIAPMLKQNITASVAKIQPGLYFKITKITTNNI